jgi:hypothetical protein
MSEETSHEKRTEMPGITYADLKAALDAMTSEQLAQHVVWSGAERGGYVQSVFVHAEDWIGDSSDPETWVPRSDAEGVEMDECEICIPQGTVHLHVD